MQKIIELGLYRHRSDEDRRVLVAELKDEIVERNRIEKELEMHVRQQRVISSLGHKALLGHDLTDLMNEAVRKVAETLDTEYCKLLELLPDGNEMLLRAGAGWKEGLVGNATVHTGLESQAGYTLRSKKPVIVEDLKTETRFSSPPLLLEHNVVSGMSVTIQGTGGPWGVLGTHTTRHVTFTKDDINFLHSVANLLANAIVRKRSEEQLIEKATEVENAHKELKDFVYTVSHDLKEPLFSIGGYFTRLYENNKDIEVEGTGVGLVIVKKIIELHRGKVWIESPIARGKGSRFCFTMPISR